MTLTRFRRALGALALSALVAGPLSGLGAAESDLPGTDTALMGPSEVAFGSLLPVVRETGRITLSTDGLGITGSSGAIHVAKPKGAAVRSAYLAAASTGFTGFQIPPTYIQIDGRPVPAWSFSTPSGLNSWNYWADVTPLVKPKIDAAAPGMISFTISESSSRFIDGTILSVIFEDPNQTSVNTVVLLFGAQAATGDTFTIGLAEPLDKNQPNLKLQMGLGISYGYQPAGQYLTVDVNGARLTSSAGGQDDGAPANGALLTVGGLEDSDANPAPFVTDAGGPRSDDELYDLLPYVQSGETSITVLTQNPSHDDNLFFSSLYLRGAAAAAGEGIVLTPSAATLPTGSDHTLTARVQDRSGAPVAGRSVTFQVLSGPGAGIVRTAATDNSGQASFTYTSAAAGTDTIKARFVDSGGGTRLSNGAVVTWEAISRAPSCQGADIAFPEDTAVTRSLGALCSDPDGDLIEIELLSASLAGVSASPAGGLLPDGLVTLTPEPNFAGSAGTIAYRAVDSSGRSSSTATAAVTVTPVNDPPTVAVASAATYVSEGGTATGAGSFSDIDSSGVSLSASAGAVAPDRGGRWTWSYTPADDLTSPQTVTITATDSDGASAGVTFSLAVSNAAPVAGSISGMPAGPIPVGSTVTLTAPYSDPGSADTHSAQWMLGPNPVPGPAEGGTASLTYTFAVPGVYRVMLAVTDDDGGSSSTEAAGYIVVYDAAGGFVTGGGWIDSPAGACQAEPALTGRANFGFVSKYKSGASVPTGQTQFRFHAGGLDFQSTAFEWLVISGSRAQMKGTGTIGGRTGTYSFMLTGMDGGAAGDAFRIKITDGAAVVYDNQIGKEEIGDHATVLSGGNIVIHKP